MNHILSIGHLYFASENTNDCQSKHGPALTSPSIDEPASMLRRLPPSDLAHRLYDAIHDEDSATGKVVAGALHLALGEPDYIKIMADASGGTRGYAIGSTPAEHDLPLVVRLKKARQTAVNLNIEIMEARND
jgi:hypothetical protein